MAVESCGTHTETAPSPRLRRPMRLSSSKPDTLAKSALTNDRSALSAMPGTMACSIGFVSRL